MHTRKWSKLNMNKRIFTILLAIIVLLPCNIIFAKAIDKSLYKKQLAQKGFPESYHEKLYQMHDDYPNWVFEPLKIDIDWNEAVANESADGVCTAHKSNTTRQLLSQSWGKYNSNGSFTYKPVDGGYVNTTPRAVAYFMDPRNFIGSERTIFQFEQLAYDANVHSLELVKNALKDTFMDGKITYKDTSGKEIKTDEQYADVILQAGKESGVNPCYLASKIIQEVGCNGSGSVSGTFPGYEGYYNFFNIGATSRTKPGGNVEKGLENAKSKEWTSPQKAIKEGAKFHSKNYISAGQSTSYLQKFDIVKKPYYTHQYMTAIFAPASTSNTTYNSYKESKILDVPRKFLIPVFKNMPDATATQITLDNITHNGKCNNNLGIHSLNVHISPYIDSTVTSSGHLYKGSKVKILGGYRETKLYNIGKFQIKYPFWYHVEFTDSKGKKQNGYVCEDFIDTDANIKLNVRASNTLKYTLYSDEKKSRKISNPTDKPMFMSMDTRIAKVNSNGKVTGMKNGTTTIVAFLVNGGFDTVKVTVGNGGTKPKPPTPDKPNPKPPTPGGPNSITSPVYKISSGYINVVNEKTPVSTFKNKINEKNYIQIYNNKNKNITNSKNNIGTGSVVKLIRNGKVLQTKTVVLRGDVNGDGKVNITDMVNVKSYLLRKKTFKGSYAKAANYNNDSKGKINITDFLQILYRLLNK